MEPLRTSVSSSVSISGLLCGLPKKMCMRSLAWCLEHGYCWVMAVACIITLLLMAGKLKRACQAAGIGALPSLPSLSLGLRLPQHGDASYLGSSSSRALPPISPPLPLPCIPAVAEPVVLLPQLLVVWWKELLTLASSVLVSDPVEPLEVQLLL